MQFKRSSILILMSVVSKILLHFTQSNLIYNIALLTINLANWRPSFNNDIFKIHLTNIWNLLEKEMATHPSILVWRIPWTGDPGRLQSLGSQIGYDWATNTHRAVNSNFLSLLWNQWHSLPITMFLMDSAKNKLWRNWRGKKNRLNSQET